MARRIAIGFFLLFPWLGIWLFPWYISYGSWDLGTVIRTPNPHLVSLGGYLLFAYWLGLIVFLLSAFYFKPKRYLVIYAVILALIILPGMLVISSFSLIGYPKLRASFRAANGRIYHVQYIGFGPGSIYALTEEQSRSQFFLRAKIMGRIMADYLPYLPLISSEKITSSGFSTNWPDNSAYRDSLWKMLDSGNGKTILALRSPKLHASMAYNLDTGKFYGDTFFDKSSFIEELSPFILIGPDDTPDSAEVNALGEYLSKETSPPEFSAALIAERDNPNPAVRLAAARILGKAWAMSQVAAPALEQISSSDPDQKVRAAAKEALISLKSLSEQHRDELDDLKGNADLPGDSN